MLFVARPETPMAKACERGEAYGVQGYRRVSLDELDELYPGNPMTLPPDTLCWSHPVGYCVSPMELCDANLKTCQAYGVPEVHGRAAVDVGADGEFLVKVDNGETFALHGHNLAKSGTVSMLKTLNVAKFDMVSILPYTKCSHFLACFENQKSVTCLIRELSPLGEYESNLIYSVRKINGYPPK